MEIHVEKSPSDEQLKQLNVFSWPIWTKEISEFPWEYDVKEVCYFLEGEVIITTDQGLSVKLSNHDLVTFPQGLKCTWKILKNVKKHYKFG